MYVKQLLLKSLYVDHVLAILWKLPRHDTHLSAICVVSLFASKDGKILKTVCSFPSRMALWCLRILHPPVLELGLCSCARHQPWFRSRGVPGLPLGVSAQVSCPLALPVSPGLATGSEFLKVNLVVPAASIYLVLPKAGQPASSKPCHPFSWALPSAVPG